MIRIKNNKLQKIIKEEIQATLKENMGWQWRGAEFANIELIREWAADAADFLHNISLELDGAAGRQANTIAEKLEVAIEEAYSHGESDAP